jgi:hypothetical protein
MHRLLTPHTGTESSMVSRTFSACLKLVLSVLRKVKKSKATDLSHALEHEHAYDGEQDVDQCGARARASAEQRGILLIILPVVGGAVACFT